MKGKTMNQNNKIITPDIFCAREILASYKRAKSSLEERMREETRVWKEVYSSEGSSSWIFNSIVNKHADIIDNIPSCTCLPREKRDEKYAEILSKIIPVITSRTNFEQTYSDNAWDKLKHGTAIYGVFWNGSLESGLGDIDIRPVRMSDVFWQIGVGDIQDSKNLFIAALADVEETEARYEGFRYSENKSSDTQIASLLGYAETGDEKCVIVDWYYKKYVGGRQILHLCKFCGDSILYASEADPSCADGWYAHGQYPLVFDRFYPCGDSACGFGLISLGNKIQSYINRIDENFMSYTDWASRVRFWAKRSLGVNEKEFLDLDRSIVEVEGDIDEEKLRQIEISPMDDSLIDVKRLKIEELKEITGSRDVSQGGVTGGVTAASAISILREAGAKASRDGIEETYRAYIKIIALVIELVGQFYEGTRIFRIVGESGENEYLSFSGKVLREDGEGYKPHFDIEISASKRSPTDAKEQNEFAKKLYESGAFKPENAKETLIMLDLMDFKGIGKLKASLRSAYGYEET